MSDQRTDFSDKPVHEWYNIVYRSIYEPVIEGVEMPRFPHGDIQRAYVGSADEQALYKARNFHDYVTQWSAALGLPLRSDTNVLDFGCGWGRVSRFFWHEVASDHIHGVDVDFDAVAVCRNLGVPGKYALVRPDGALPFADRSMDLAYAVSVFTHLALPSADHWMKELARVVRPGGVLAVTVESRKFLEQIPSIDPATTSLRGQLMARYREAVPGLLERFDNGEFVLLGNGDPPGEVTQTIAAIPESFFRSRWGADFEVRAYVEAHEHLGQALVLATRT